MTSIDRLQAALRSAWLPLALLLTALSTVFIFGGDRGHFYRSWEHNGLSSQHLFYRPWEHNGLSSQHLTVAVNLSHEHGFQQFLRRTVDEDGVTRYRPYNRFPIGGYAIIKLATLLVIGDLSAQITAARIVMLLFVSGAAVLAYLSLRRLVSNRWIALTATLLSFSSYYLLYYNDMIAASELGVFFGLMLTFHGMVVFIQEGRFRQLVVKTCIALLLGWHVFALVLPFVVFGLASELLRARSAAADSPHQRTVLHQGKHAAALLLRSRYLLLGTVALAFGLSVLTFNFAMEYIALDGETPLTELPSIQSMLMRTGWDADVNAAPVIAAGRAWRPFMEDQFGRILRMFIPYSLLGSGDAVESLTWLPNGLTAVLGVVLSAACLIGSMLIRPRILFATLTSFGFFWTLPMRNSSAFHEFEAIYYVGIPLVFFTLALLLVRRLTNRDGVIASVSVVALLLFAVSSFQMSRFGYSTEEARTVRTAAQELTAIRERTTGELVNVLGGIHKSFFNGAGHAMDYYLNSSLIRYGYLPSVDGGFVVMRDRIDTDALLTPQNQYLFLYDRNGLTEWYETTYRTITSREPATRSEFDLYIDDGKLHYVKEPCGPGDTVGRFFLHVYPFDEEDLPAARRQRGFENVDFTFTERGVLFDGKCLASVDIPQYDVVKVNTGRVDGDAWSATHVVVSPRLTFKYRTIVSREPAARSEFDLYIDDGKLHYVKEPCERTDTAARFFLHTVPDDIDDLPDARRQHGFDNLDFDFVEPGLLFDGKCLVSVDIPQYGIARITTGQFDGDGRIWEAEFAPVANE